MLTVTYSIKMKNYILALMGFIGGLPCAVAQTTPVVTGVVTNELEELLIGAAVYWKNTQTGTTTDTAGHFILPAMGREATLVVKYVGYTPVEVQVLPTENKLWIEVTGATQLQTMTVTEHSFGNTMSTLDPRNVEHVTSKELRRAPCCNLSESFQTNGAIDVSYPNAVTGVKEIQLLGLRGIYSQFLVENRPTMTGIATPFAFEYIPGTWLAGVDLAKGASSVKNGYTGITGQVNADLVKPMTDKPLFVNAFTSTEGRGELNVHLNRKVNKNLANGLLLHGSFVQNKWDMNDDNFRDSPNRQQLNALYRVQYDGPLGCAQINIQALTDRRQGGQFNISPGATELFSVDQNNDRVEVWGKYGREGVFGKPYNQIGNIASVSWHRTSALYGHNTYEAKQQSVYWTTLFESIIGTTNHKYVIAPSLQYDDIQEFVNESNLSRREAVPGVMAEYTYSHPNLDLEIPDLVVVLGARTDWNSRFGWLFTPRMSAKYNFTAKNVLRVSAGRGYRSPNLIAENISLLASNRSLDFASDIGIEAAWNYGANYTHNFKVAGREASISADIYRTDFTQQVVVDVERDYSKVFFYNLNGKSYSNSFLVNLQYNVLPGLDIKLAGKWNDVRATYFENKLRTVPLVARLRGLVTVDYTTPNKKWLFNMHAQIVGPQRLPDNSQVPHEYRHDFPETSPTFALWNIQITRHWDKFEIYVGGENLTGFQQHHAIIAANEPWSPYFNGSQIWAPMMRQIGFVGVRIVPAGI